MSLTARQGGAAGGVKKSIRPGKPPSVQARVWLNTACWGGWGSNSIICIRIVPLIDSYICSYVYLLLITTVIILVLSKAVS